MTPIIQMICRQSQPVAVTVGTDEATLSADVASRDLALVQAMCVYALEIAAGERPGPYRDGDAPTVTATGWPCRQIIWTMGVILRW